MRLVSQGLSSALKGRVSIARGVSPGNGTPTPLFFRPEGACVNSPGREPRERDASASLSPEGATVAPGGCCRPFRAQENNPRAVAYPGLTPRALDTRPFRAEDRKQP